MKKLVLALLASATVLPAHAQLFSPESVTGAVVGGIAGGVIGHNNGRHGAEGAAIGAGVGLLAGALVRESRERSGYYDSPRVHVDGYYSSGHVHSGGYYRSGYSHPGGYHRYHYYHVPRYSYYQPYYVAPTYVQPAPVVVEAPQPAAQPAQQTTIINNYYNSAPNTPLSGANSLFGR